MATGTDYASESQRPKLSIEGLRLGPMQGSVTGRVIGEPCNVSDFKSKGGKAQVFSFVLGDETAEIRVSVFGKELRPLHDICKSAQVVRIAGGFVKSSHPTYNRTDNKLEVSLSMDSKGSIVLSNELVSSRQVEFTDIFELGNLASKKLVNVSGVITAVTPRKEVQKKDQSMVALSKVTLVDSSKSSVECAFWGDKADQVQWWSIGDILEIRRAAMHEYAGMVTLTCTEARKCDSDDYKSLSKWFDEAQKEELGFSPVMASQSMMEQQSQTHQPDSTRVLVYEHPPEALQHYGSVEQIQLRFGEISLTFNRNEQQPVTSTPEPSTRRKQNQDSTYLV